MGKPKTQKKPNYQIPYDKKGQMVTYSKDSGIVEWRGPEEFYQHIIFKHFERGRSAAHTIFHGPEPEHGDVYQVFLTDLADMIPHMEEGVVSGNFIPIKRGMNFGIRLVGCDHCDERFD